MTALLSTGRGPGWDDGGWGGMHDGLSWVGWLFMALFLLFVLALVAGVVLLLLRSSGSGRAQGGSEGGSEGAGPGPSSAEQLLDQRYARGEIDEDEYLRRRSVLRGGG